MDKTIVLKEVYQGSTAKFDRWHLLISEKGRTTTPLGYIQETAGTCEYNVYQLANSTTRLELTNGGAGKPPILEVHKGGSLIFRTVLGGRRPRPLTIPTGGEVIKLIPCNWGCKDPHEIWGPSTKVEEVSGDDPPSSEGEGKDALPI